MKKDKRAIIDLDDLQFRISCGIKAISAIHELIDGAGGFIAEEYADALFAVYDYLNFLNIEFREALDAKRAVSE